MSEIQRKQESILLLDVGTCNTKAVLLDLVEEQYRLVATAQAPSTVHEPWQDLSLGAVEAIARLEEVCGRTLLGPAQALGSEMPGEGRSSERALIIPEDQDGCGVDRLLMVSSAGEPLQVLVAGLVHEVSLASARRAVQTTYARVQDVIALEQAPGASSGDHHSAGAKINAVLQSDADVLLLVGGTDGGASEPLVDLAREVLRVALFLMEDDAPLVLYAGNQAVTDDILELLEDVATVRVADNVRPVAEIEDSAPAARELNSLFYERKMRMLPGLRTIHQWSRTLVRPTVRATETAVRCCAQVFETGKPALGVDLGSASVALHLAQAHRVHTAVRTDLGIGSRLPGLLEQVEVSDILRWLPFEMSETAFLDWFYHKARHPQTLPQTRHDLLQELACARELLHLALADLLPLPNDPPPSPGEALLAPPCDPIVGTGSLLAHAPHPGLAALVLLDALQPRGVSTLYQDESGLLPAVGSVAEIDPLATVQVLEGEGLLCLGTVIAPQGKARRGRPAITVRSLDPEVEIDRRVGYGELCVLSAAGLGASTRPTLFELNPTRPFDLGRGPGKSIQIACKLGALGLIVDARGRPIEIAADAQARREQMDEWLFTMTGERGA
jgi:hypothetical protein